MKQMIRIDEMLSRVVRVIVGALLFIIMVVLFISVIARYFLNSPIIWADELVTYLLICMTFLGGYIALRSDRLVRVTFVLSLFPGKARRAVHLFSQVVICAFLTIIGVFSVRMLSSPVALSQRTVALRMPMIIFYALIPVMIAMMLLRMAINIRNDFRSEQPKKEESV
ncbi:MAG: TRAP transporter small permease [Clostridiales bacterium]|nr:TRAP transporter small permease [Clostridiales bacterium]